MKTERRHELQTNVLADWIGHKTEAIRPYFKLIVGGIGAVFIVAIGATLISNQQLERSSRGWADYFAASTGDSPDRLRTVAEEHAGTLPAVWATQREADLELARGIRALYTSRGEATEALSSAKKLYQQVEAGAAGQPALKQAAQFGTAQAFEAEGEVEKASDYYEKVIATAPDSSLGKQAQARRDLLEDKEAADWLVWFARQTPQAQTQAQGGFDLPRDLTEIPGRPDLSIPVPIDDTNERAESSLPIDEPAAKTPAAEATTDPTTNEPEAKKPEPAEPEAKTPAAETPETETPETKTPETKTPETEPGSPAPAPDPAPESAPATPPAADAPAKPPAASPPGDGAASQ